jgi:deazaflavin-dependent oxidoreductase (nitroreductase family)
MIMTMSDRLEQYQRDPLAANRAIVEQFRASGGRPAGFSRLLLLTTTGARSGQPRTTPLGYAVDGSPDRFIVFASNMAAPSDPAWYRNLVANPEVTVEVGGDRFPARARTTRGPERDRAYRALAEQMPVGDHESKAGREIPVVILERLR